MSAAFAGDLAAMKRLVIQCAKVNEANAYSNTPLHFILRRTLNRPGGDSHSWSAAAKGRTPLNRPLFVNVSRKADFTHSLCPEQN
jgi:hypothetical protein